METIDLKPLTDRAQIAQAIHDWRERFAALASQVEPNAWAHPDVYAKINDSPGRESTSATEKWHADIGETPSQRVVTLNIPVSGFDENVLGAVGIDAKGRRWILRQGFLRRQGEHESDVTLKMFPMYCDLEPIKLEGAKRNYYAVANIDGTSDDLVRDMAAFVTAFAAVRAKVNGERVTSLQAPNFKIEQIYNRRRDIHTVYGGQQQGRICTPAKGRSIFIFTGGEGKQHGYSDGWIDGVFNYTGEGQRGDMSFRAGNKAIRDHNEGGKDLLVFESLGTGGNYLFKGTFSCIGWKTVRAPDSDHNERDAIVFQLVPVDQVNPEAFFSEPTSGLSIEELRERALAAAVTTKEPGKQSARIYYQRSAAVRTYVLARAKGICECCGKDAPFLRASGEPYLEPHHTHKVSDGGPDHPSWVAGVCPTCHRAIHHGIDGAKINASLQERLKIIEPNQS